MRVTHLVCLENLEEVTEYCRIPVEKIDIITGAMGHALATEGGFCTGSARVTDHQFLNDKISGFGIWQRLSSSGYVFSASLPPYLASAAITAIDVLEEDPGLITKLKKNTAILWKGLSAIQCLSFASSPESRIVFLRLEKADSVNPFLSFSASLLLTVMVAVMQLLKEHSIFVVASQKSTLDKCRLPLGIRLFVSAGHT
ncbi:hypothetical protein FF1_015513 [Malus domestica]